MPELFQPIHKAVEIARHTRLQAANFLERFDALPGIVAASAIAQQHPPQPRLPGVAFQSLRQVETAAMFAVQAPADVGAVHPLAYQWKVALGDTEPAAYGRHFQQADDLADAKTAFGQRHQRVQCNQHRLTMPLALVGNGERDVAPGRRRVTAKHRLDVRCVGVDVWHHDDHVAGPKLRVAVECRQQLVVKNLHFPLRAVGIVKHHGIVLERIEGPCLPQHLCLGSERTNVVLDLVQQRRLIRISVGRENIDPALRSCHAALVRLGVVELVQQANVVPPLFAPGRQQGVGVLVEGIRVGQCRQFRVGLAALAVRRQQVTVADDVGPVKFAGIMDTEHHLADPAENGQGFQRLLRQG